MRSVKNLIQCCSWICESGFGCAGDLNCAHTELDIHNPKSNLKSAGFTPVHQLLLGN